MDSYPVTIDQDTFRCAHYWQGMGSPDPAFGCDPICSEDGEDIGGDVSQDTYHATPGS